jgi:Flp pilus assembly protein TadG
LRKKLFGVFLILLSMVIVSVSAFVYETAQHTVTQTVKDVATLTLQNSALGDIEEGSTNFYTKSNASSLGNIVTLTTTKDDVYLHFNSDLDSNSSLGTYYTTYTITVKFAAVGSGSSHSVGDVACTMSLGSSDPSAVTLDKLGTWTFDFEITTTAKQVSSDAGTTVTIVVTAEST